MPDPLGSGIQLWMYSCLRAYLDNGYSVEIVNGSEEPVPEETLDVSEKVSSRALPKLGAIRGGRLVIARAAYLAGRPFELGFLRAFPQANDIRNEILRRAGDDSATIHHFADLRSAAMGVGVPKIRTCYAAPDILADFFQEHAAIRARLRGYRKAPAWQQRELAWSIRAEARIVREVDLLLCISETDRAQFEARRKRNESLVTSYFPFGLPKEPKAPLPRGGDQAQLRLIHIGNVSGLASFSSLEFLLSEVFPLLDEETRRSLRLDIIGSVGTVERARRIVEYAERYKEVVLHGHVPSLEKVYDGADVQLVGSTVATGVRTRIVESLARGLPVLSTERGARGLKSLVSGRNILLAATARDYAGHLKTLVQDRSVLRSIQAEGRRWYEENHSRTVVANSLSGAIEAVGW